MSLKIHVYTICWNESGMLPHFLNYYSGFCEKIFVYDNCSTDGSLDICKEFSKVHTKTYFTGNQIRDDIYIKIKNDCWKNSRGECDYVIVCDIDEFIYHPAISAFLEESFHNGITLFQSKGYNMISENYPGRQTNIFREITEGSRAEGFDKFSVFNPNKVEEINYDYGAHVSFPIGELHFSTHELKLLHYKYMGIDHMIARYKELGSRLSQYNKKRNLSYHYLFPAGRIKREFREVWKNREQIVS